MAFSIMLGHIMSDITTLNSSDMLTYRDVKHTGRATHILSAARASDHIKDVCGGTGTKCLDGIFPIGDIRFVFKTFPSPTRILLAYCTFPARKIAN